MKRQALQGALTAKFDDGAIKVVQDLLLDNIKTRELVGYLDALQATGRVLVVSEGKDEKLELSARNVPGLVIIRADSLNIVDVLDADILLITQLSLPTMAEVYA
jgi:large subunit ribosomal protein L4